MKALFAEELHWAECLWGRGIVPATLGTFKKETVYANDLVTNHSENMDEVLARIDLLATDGSGGPGWAPAEARTHASVVVAIQQEKDE